MRDSDSNRARGGERRLATWDRWRREVLEQAALAVFLVRWIVLGALSGVLAGASSYVFLEGLDRVTKVRVAHPWLLWLLPVAGALIGVAYHYLGGRSSQGNALLIDQIHEPTEWVPRRMAPLVLAGTWVTHLFGGSAGREGTALQMSGSLTDAAARLLRLSTQDRRLLLVAALGGGFGAVFGVPLAGAVLAMRAHRAVSTGMDASAAAFVDQGTWALMSGAAGAAALPALTPCPRWPGRSGRGSRCFRPRRGSGRSRRSPPAGRSG